MRNRCELFECRRELEETRTSVGNTDTIEDLDNVHAFEKTLGSGLDRFSEALDLRHDRRLRRGERRLELAGDVLDVVAEVGGALDDGRLFGRNIGSFSEQHVEEITNGFPDGVGLLSEIPSNVDRDLSRSFAKGVLEVGGVNILPTEGLTYLLERPFNILHHLGESLENSTPVDGVDSTLEEVTNGCRDGCSGTSDEGGGLDDTVADSATNRSPVDVSKRFDCPGTEGFEPLSSRLTGLDDEVLEVGHSSDNISNSSGEARTDVGPDARPVDTSDVFNEVCEGVADSSCKLQDVIPGQVVETTHDR